MPARGSLLTRPIAGVLPRLQCGFDKLSARLRPLDRRLLRVAVLALVVYAGLIGLTGWQFVARSDRLHPEPGPGLSDHRHPAAARRLARAHRCRGATQATQDHPANTPGVAHAVPFAGFDGATFTNAPNAGAIFSPLAAVPGARRQGAHRGRDPGRLAQAAGAIQDAFIITIPPPPVRGIGTAGGFKMMVQDKRGRGLPALEAATQELVTRGQPDPRPRRRLLAVQHRARPRSMPISTGCAPRCWACRPTACSRRCRSISARPTSMTSTISAEPTG